MAGKHVFISYSSRDRAVAERLLRSVEQRGVACWMAPRDVAPGENFGSAITAAIDNAYAMILVFSANANRNAEEIKKEIVLASQGGLVVVPARIENLLPSDGAFRYELSTRQWVDLFDNWDQGVERLVGHLAHVKPDGTGASASGRPTVSVSPPAPAFVPRPSAASWRRTALIAAAAIVASGAGAWFATRLGAPTTASAPAPPTTATVAQPQPTQVQTTSTAPSTPPAVTSIAGTWQSAFGPVTLTQDGQSVKGSWQQAGQGTGEIYSGSFAPATGVLEILYRQPWNKGEGEARFVLSADGRTLRGTWRHRKVEGNTPPNGEWTLNR